MAEGCGGRVWRSVAGKKHADVELLMRRLAAPHEGCPLRDVYAHVPSWLDVVLETLGGPARTCGICVVLPQPVWPMTMTVEWRSTRYSMACSLAAMGSRCRWWSRLSDAFLLNTTAAPLGPSRSTCASTEEFDPVLQRHTPAPLLGFGDPSRWRTDLTARRVDEET